MSKNLKILYVTNYSLSDSSDGITNKILQQVKAFHLNGFEVEFAYLKNSSIYVKSETAGPFAKHLGVAKVLFYALLPIFLRGKDRLWDVVYVRNPHSSFYPLFFPLFLFFVRSKVKKIIIDIPSYPYDKELSGFKGKLGLVAHKFSRPFISRYVDEIYYTGALIETIWGVRSKRIYNSFLESECPPIKKKNIGPGIIFIGVGNLRAYHGYDRLINSMAVYRDSHGSCPFLFNIVSPINNEVSKLKSLVSKLRLKDNVFFHGKLSGQSLDEIFDRSDIGVDSLARHRTGNFYNDSIKSKEYVFRCIPFIKSHKDDSVDGTPFCYTVSQSDDAFDLSVIVLWHRRLNVENLSFRKYALDNFLWEKQYLNMGID